MVRCSLMVRLIISRCTANVYDVVDRPFLVLSELALNRLVEVLAK